MPFIISDSEWNVVVERYESGESIRVISESYPMTAAGIRNRLKNSGVAIRPKLDNISGNVYGKLTAVSLSEMSRNGHARWHVKCECGTEKTVLATHLKSGKTVSCGCILKQQPRNFQGVGLLTKTYYSSVKRGADGGKGRKPLEFNVSMEYLWDIFEKQEGVCAYSKLPIDFRSRTASLDRIDSSVGYVEGNVQWLHKDVNMMKRHYSEEYFINLCNVITENS